MQLFNKNKSLVGLDIGSSAIKAVELTRSKKGYQITGFACENLVLDAVVDGAIMDSALVADAIKRTWASGKFKPKKVATGVSGQSVIVKRVILPAATADDVDASIQFDAEQHIPFQMAEVNLDYEVIGETNTEEPAMEVLLVVAKKDKIHNQTNAVSLAGCVPEVVDIDAFALQNAFEANYSVGPDAAIALLNIGASLMNINITKGGMPLFIRDVPVGGNQYTDILQKELQLSFQDAEDLKTGKRSSGADTEMVEPLIEFITDMLVIEVQKTFDFFRETYPSETISRVFISGGTAQVPGLAKIEQAFGHPTEVMDPFRTMTFGPKVDAARIKFLGPALAVAVGLALRGFD